MIKLTDATYEELETLSLSIKYMLDIISLSDDRERDILKIWHVQILTAMQIVKDRETTNQN